MEMKTRIGFVSNSSSSSFLIYGAELFLDLNVIENGKRCKDVSDALYNLAVDALKEKNIEERKWREDNVHFMEIKDKISYELYIKNHHRSIIKKGQRCDGISDEIYKIALDHLKQNPYKIQTSIMYDEVIKKIGHDIEYHEYEGYYIGRSWDKVRDDQTGKEFKDEIEQILHKYFTNCECKTHEYAWRDG